MSEPVPQASGRFVVLGCRGMLGRALAEELALHRAKPVLLDLPEFDIADPEKVRDLFGSAAPKVVFNATGYTDVDGAERDRAAAERANVTGPGLLAEAAAEAEACLVHVSTDYVFDGAKGAPYVERDQPSPGGVYAKTKFEGEKAVRRSGSRHLIVRTAWLYAPWGKNFVRTIITKAREGGPLRVVDDQRGSPTYAPDLARAMLKLAASGAEGTYHVVNEGEATWHDVATEAVRLAGLDADIPEIEKIATAELPHGRGVRLPAPRPAYSVLSTEKLRKKLDGPLRDWREALAECVERME